jgi:hypothetical protein
MDAGESLPPVRAITRGPRYHWFGYYDKLQFDAAGRQVLGMQVDFEHRSPKPDDIIRLGVIDIADGDRWKEIGVSRAWNWQQGSMLQWLPGSKTEVIWNDRDADRFVSRILNVRTGKMRTIAAPVGKDGGERILRTVGSPACVAKNRYGLPAELPLTWDALVAAMAQGVSAEGTPRDPA